MVEEQDRPDSPADEPEDPSSPLLSRWQEEGDPEALDRLLRLEVGVLKDMIQRRGRGMLGASVGVTDVAQEAVLGLLRVNTAPSFENPKALRAYLWKSAWRLLLHRLKKRRAASLDLTGTSSSAMEGFLATTGGMSGVENNDRSLALQVAMNLLKPAERDILHLVYFQHLDIPTAAKKLKTSKDAANMRLVRARRSLAQRLSDWTELIG